jgi:hypothetical protein
MMLKLKFFFWDLQDRFYYPRLIIDKASSFLRISRLRAFFLLKDKSLSGASFFGPGLPRSIEAEILNRELAYRRRRLNVPAGSASCKAFCRLYGDPRAGRCPIIGR